MSIKEDPGEQRDYVSYLLRMWQDGGDKEPPQSKEAVWRATLQSPRTGERVGFASMDELVAFLLEQTGLEPTVNDVQNEV